MASWGSTRRRLCLCLTGAPCGGATVEWSVSISELGGGHTASRAELVYIMLSLQVKGCHNIDLVSPTHVVCQILEALELATESGLHLPLVCKSGGYDCAEALRVRAGGVVDIYMPGMKYHDEESARREEKVVQDGG